MRYSVIAADGSQYGPVDIATLNQWIAEGRVLPTTMLVAENGTQIQASAVAGLYFGPAAGAPPAGPASGTVPPGSPEMGHAPYARVGMGYAPGTGLPPEIEKKFNWGAFCLSWIWGLNHKAYLTLISLALGVVNIGLSFGRVSTNPLGIVGIGLAIWYGRMGNKWAWESGRFATVEDMLACQSIWAKWGLGVILVSICLCIGSVVFLGAALGVAAAGAGGR